MSNPQGFDYNQWATVHLNRPGSRTSSEAATPESVVQDGIDQAVGTVAKVTLGVNPGLKGQGGIPSETHVSGGLSLQSLTVLKDVPGGILAGLGKYFTRSWEWLLGKGGDTGGGASGSTEGSSDSGDGGGNAAETDAVSAPGRAFADSFHPELMEYGGKLIAFDPVEVPLSRLGELAPPDTPTIAREELSTGLAA